MSELAQADDRRLVHYLLGLLPEDEAERLERASIEDDDLATRLRLLEQELIDAYVRGRLPAELLARVERHYASSPRRLQRIKQAEVFFDAIDRAAERADANALADGRSVPPTTVVQPANSRWLTAPAAAVLVAARQLRRFRPADAWRSCCNTMRTTVGGRRS